MTTLDFAGTAHSATAPLTRTRHGIRCVQLHDELWRVTRTDGSVLGYLERFADPRGERFRSKRLLPLQQRFVVIGEFWSIDDAIDALRFG